MAATIQSVHVQRFRCIKDAPFDVDKINVFIGANNAGKSTLAQIIHFAIGLLQSIELQSNWGNQYIVSRSISPEQLLYSPCVDLYALGYGGRLREASDSAIVIDITLGDGRTIIVSIKKGRNGNIQVVVDNVEAAKEVASLEHPFTIYSPGLAGIARHENYMSDGVLLRTIARGDANLVLRNVLFRLSRDGRNDDWTAFTSDLQELFPELEFRVSFDQSADEYINVIVQSGNNNYPVELAGTGILQATQILAYVHYFHPSVIILDEPDSHLHPNNQRLLCQLLQSVATERNTQVILTTHSRHIVDALSGQSSFLWVRSGTAEKIDQDYDLAVLLDIGALDVKEMVSHSDNKRCIVLTEDTGKRPLEKLLWASGIPESDTLVLAYHGCTSPKNLRPLIDLIRSGNQQAAIVVHRDRDYLNATEAEDWKIKIRNLHAKPFLTDGVDIESHFLNVEHLTEQNNCSIEEMQTLIDEATLECRPLNIEKYVNGRSDIEKKNGTYGALNVGQLAVEASSKITEEFVRYRHSKTVLKCLRSKYHSGFKQTLRVYGESEHIKNVELGNIANALPRATTSHESDL